MAAGMSATCIVARDHVLAVSNRAGSVINQVVATASVGKTTLAITVITGHLRDSDAMSAMPVVSGPTVSSATASALTLVALPFAVYVNVAPHARLTT